jgi:hypothetical protein
MSEEYSVIPWYVRSGDKSEVQTKSEKEQDALEGG